MKTLHMELGAQSYDILVGRGLLGRAGKLLSLRRRVLVVTDDGVPAAYAKAVADQCGQPVLVTLPAGEGTKSMENLSLLLCRMLAEGFTRADCVAAVGGGVVGDLAGFAASCYMRGVDFYNLPTTLLAQVDSSIGGKVAVDFEGVKNIVGAFYQPKAVLIDPDVLATLAPRQLSNGMAEAIKTGLVGDEVLFHIFEQERADQKIDEVIWRSLAVKKYVVERDERETALRKTLNFGHTLGHAIESAAEPQSLLHGECVGLGMLAICDSPLKERVRAVLQKYRLPTEAEFDRERARAALRHDKKGDGESVLAVRVDLPGKARLSRMQIDELDALL